MVPERDLSGTVLAGRYRVLSQIGSGGMGTVHAGEHIGVGRKVAIKILRPEALSKPSMVERFRREARLTARIEHEHVVECLDVGATDDGLCFYVMEWLRGEDLQTVLRRERVLPWPRARSIVSQLCRALAAAHERGVVHRDLKPGNIFLIRREDNPDFVKILDFGIAKLVAPDEAPGEILTRAGEVVGTTPYMSPELAAGEPFDHRIDVYAAGVILFQALSGRLPFRGRTPRQILTEILVGDPPSFTERNPQLVVSPALETLLTRAMHRDLQQRYPDMAALHEALMDLPDDACVPVDVSAPGPDPSASESAMAVSAYGPMRAGNEPTQQTGGDPTPRPGEPATVLEVPRPVPARTRWGLIFMATAVLALAAGVAVYFAWPQILAALAPGSEVASVSEPTAGDTKPDPEAVTRSPIDPVNPTLADPKPAATTAVDTPPSTETKPDTPPIETKPDAPPTETKPDAPPPSETKPDAPPTETKPDAPSTETKPDAPPTEAKPDAPPTEAKPRADRSEFDEVMRKATAKVRRCLATAGLQPGTRVRFDVAVEARTGRITSASPRAPHEGRRGLGECVVDGARGTTVRPAPANEWRRSYEFVL